MGDGRSSVSDGSSISKALRGIAWLVSNYSSSKHLSKADAAARRRRLLALRRVLLRLLSLVGTHGLSMLFGQPQSSRYSDTAQQFLPKLRNILALVNFAKGYDIGEGYSGAIASWSATLGTSLWVSDFSIPMWWVTYNGLSCIAQSRIGAILDSNAVRQALLNVSVVLAHHFSKRHGHTSILAPFALNTGFLTDLAAVYGLMCGYSLYRCAQRLFTSKTADVKKLQEHYREQLRSLADTRALSLPALAKFREIYELSREQRRTLRERLLGSFVLGNVQPSVQWALWRQLCRLVVGRVGARADILLQCVMLTVGQNVINGGGAMPVNRTLLRAVYAVQSAQLLGTRYKLPNTWRKVLLFVLSVLNRSIALARAN